jgi:hypothetical protein
VDQENGYPQGTRTTFRQRLERVNVECMHVLPDASALRSRARQIAAEADEVSRHCAALRATANQTQWVSLAASRFRARADDLCVDLDRASDQLRHAAAALRAHADTVDHVLTVTLAVPRVVGGLLERGTSTVAHLVGR